MSELSRIWLLSDISQDQRLDRQEFAIAMFLIRCRLQGRDIPTPLPEVLISSARDDFVPPVQSGAPIPSKDARGRYDINLDEMVGGGAVSPAISSVPSNNPTSPIPSGTSSLPTLSIENAAGGVPSLERRFSSATNLQSSGGAHQGGAFLSTPNITSPAAMSPAVSSAPAVLQPGAQFPTLSPAFGGPVNIVPSTVWAFIRF